MQFPKKSQPQWFGRTIDMLTYDSIVTTSLSCLLFVARLSGSRITLGEIFSLAPFSTTFSYNALSAAARRLGFVLSNSYHDEIASYPALGVLQNGYTFLILGRTTDSAFLMLPGINNDINILPSKSDIVEDASLLEISATKRLQRVRFTPVLKSEILHKLSLDNIAPLFDVETIVEWNRLLFTGSPEIYGRIRVQKLVRLDCNYFPPIEIRSGLEKLMRVARFVIQAPVELLPRYLIYLYLDFGAIHPFLNGNGRVAVRFVLQVAAMRGLKFDVSLVPRSELYYWVASLHRRKWVSKRIVELISRRVRLEKI